MERMTYKQWPCRCSECGFNGKILAWSHQLPPQCPDCGAKTTLIDNFIPEIHGIITDSFVGGLMVPHAVCHPDGTPRRFDSKSELRRELAKAGYTIMGETPNVRN